jgi:hypothetical protein
MPASTRQGQGRSSMLERPAAEASTIGQQRVHALRLIDPVDRIAGLPLCS